MAGISIHFQNFVLLVFWVPVQPKSVPWPFKLPIAEGDLELLIFLHPPPKCQDCIYISPYLAPKLIHLTKRNTYTLNYIPHPPAQTAAILL